MSDEVVTGRHDAVLAKERRLLAISTAGAAVAAGLGIVWGLLADSQVVLLDGAYALIGLGLGALSIRAAALVERGATPKYPFGREALGPLVVGVQGLVLLGTFGFAAFDAIGVILDGGSDTALGSALLYAVVSLVGCLVVWAYLRARSGDSELVAAEAAQWVASWVLSGAMVIGFAVGFALQNSSYSTLAAYVDPVLVLVAVALILPTPVAMLRTTFRELLEGRPVPEVSQPIEQAVHEVSEQHGLTEPTTRIGKLGRKVYLEVDYLVGDGHTVDEADVIRRQLLDRLTEPGRLLWINVELHTDPDWDRM